jgi:hypothetical protein
VTTVDLTLDANSAYAYRAVVMPGIYTVALACQAQLDVDGDQMIDFVSPLVDEPVMIAIGMPAENVNF